MAYPEGLRAFMETDVKWISPPIKKQAIPMSSTEVPKFFSQPFRFLRYASHQRPHIVLSFILGISGPLAAVTLYSAREKYLYKDAPQIPASYPLPGKRDANLTGYDD